MKTKLWLYRLYLAAVCGLALYHGRNCADRDDQLLAIGMWLIATVSGVALQLTFTLKRES